MQDFMANDKEAELKKDKESEEKKEAKTNGTTKNLVLFFPQNGLPRTKIKLLAIQKMFNKTKIIQQVPQH